MGFLGLNVYVVLEWLGVWVWILQVRWFVEGKVVWKKEVGDVGLLVWACIAGLIVRWF